MPGFELKGKIGLNSSAWKSGLDQAERQASQFSGRVASRLGSAISASLIGAITAGVAAGVAAAISSLGKGARIRDLSKRIGVTPERFQELEFAATQSGATGEQVVAAIKGLSKTQQRANDIKADGTFKDPGLRSTFAKFGVTDEDLALSPAALFQVIGERVGQGFNSKDRLADIQKLMEEAGVAMLPVFLSGLSDAIKSAQDLGTITNQNVATLGSLDDEKTNLAFQAGNAAANTTARFARFAQSPPQGIFASGASAGPGAPPQVFFDMQRTLKTIEENTAPLKQ